MKETDKRLNVAFVGGGAGCKAIMELILCDRFSELKMNILGVASRNPESPGAVYAKGLGIYLTSDYRDFYRVGDLDLIIEVTGSDEVLEEILKTRPPRVKVMDHVSARLFWDFMHVEERYRGLYDNAPDMYHTLDKDGIITECNQAWERKTGYSKREIVGQPVSRFYSEKSREDFHKDFPEIIERKKIAGIERELITKECRTINVMIESTRVLDRDGGVVELRSIMRDTAERKQAEEELRQSHNLLDSISRAQSQYILDADPHVLFDDLLRDLLSLTQSEYGFIGEVLYASSGDPYLKTHAITNIAWNKETQEFYDKHAPTGLEFYNLNTLFGAVMTTGKPVIANDPLTDPRRGGPPEGHPPLNTFLGLPFSSGEKLVGMVGIANRPDGYDEELVEYLQPLLVTCRNIIEAYRNEQQRKRAEEALHEQAQILSSIRDTIVIITPEMKTIYANQMAKDLFGDRPEMFTEPCYRFFQKRDNISEDCPVIEVFKDEKPHKAVLKSYDKDGREIWRYNTAFPFYDQEGRLIGSIEIITDHTAQKMAEIALRESEEKYRGIFENLTDFVYTLDLDGNFTNVNKAAEHLSGYKKAELTKMNFRDYTSKDAHEEIFQAFHRVFKTGKPLQDFPLEVRVKGGIRKHFETSVVPLRKGKTIIGFQGSSRDITDRVKAEEALRESEEKYRTILESIEDGYYEVDLAGNHTFFNDSLSRILGYSKDELMGVNYRQYTPPDDAKRGYQVYNQVYRTGKPIKGFDWEVTRKDATKIHTELSASLIRGPEGQPTGFRGIVRDITEKKKAEEGLRKSEEKYRTILESIEDGYFEVDIAGNFTFFNDSLCRILGYPRDELMGMNNRQYMVEEAAKELYKAFNRVYNTGIPTKGFVWEIIIKDGTKGYVESSASLIKDAEGKRIGFRGIMRDITERVHLEKKIKESEERYRHLIEHANAGIVLVSGEYFVFANKKMSEMVGYTIEELTSTPFLEFIAPRDRQLVEERYRRRQRGEKPPQIYDFWMIRRDGTEICVELAASLTEVNGEIATLAVMRDITEKKKAEEELEYLKQYNEKVVASIPSSLLVLDRNLNIKSVNQTYLEIGGVKHEDVVGRNIKEVFPGHLLKEGGLLQAFEEVMETGEPFRLHDVRHTSTRHPEKILNFTVSGIRVAEEEEEEEEEATLILVIEDVTERARLREEIRKSRDFMNTIFETSVDIVVTTDESGIITFVNRAIERIAGYKEEELIGRHASELYDRGRERAKDIIGILTSGQVLKSYRLRLLAKQGKEIPISISGSLLKDSQGRVIGTLGFIRDVSRLVEAEEELRKKNEELENFVYVVSHDLKSPIVSMQGFSSMLLNDYGEKLGERGERYIKRIRANASRMEILISDLLALSRVGRVVGAFEDVSSIEIVNTICKRLKSRMEENRIEIFIGDDLPIIHCDGDRIYQVFENLIVNAIKFMGDTQEPRIEIGYEEKGEFHQFHVRDNGISIDPKYHSKIFEIFQRLREIEDAEGTGIGLVIVERIVKNHGGKVCVESQKGEGATFYFTLPKMPS